MGGEYRARLASVIAERQAALEAEFVPPYDRAERRREDRFMAKPSRPTLPLHSFNRKTRRAFARTTLRELRKGLPLEQKPRRRTRRDFYRGAWDMWAARRMLAAAVKAAVRKGAA